MEAWREELARPTEGFFKAFAAVARRDHGPRDAAREAVKVLSLAVDWEAYLPHVPHGLLGLRAVFRLEEHLRPASFLRILATQIHAFAHEGRRRKGLVPAQGSGTWTNLESFIAARKPALAHMEAHSFAAPVEGDFQRLQALVAHDMAIVGHKGALALHFEDLWIRLERPKATGRRLFAQAAWMAATPEDAFWHRRASTRIPEGVRPTEGPAVWNDETREAFRREVCDLGLVELFNRLGSRFQDPPAFADLVDGLVSAACEKLLDARRDLEGKTGWCLVHLANLAVPPGDARHLAQAAALVNLFPTDEAEGRIRPLTCEGRPGPPQLTDAILDAEPARAMGLALALAETSGASSVLASLAEAASANDPAFNHAHQMLLVAAAADLLPRLREDTAKELLAAVAKSLANSQGSGDLGRLAEKALA